VRVDVLSETSWFDNDNLKKHIVDYGGAMTNQYDIPWDWDNAGGYMALLTVTTLEGKERKILLDSGWNNDWVDYIYEMNNIPAMLKSGEIEFMVISHWHLDHYWGIESTLKHKPDITMYAPKTYYPEDMALLKGAHLTAKKRGQGCPCLQKRCPPCRANLILCDPDGDQKMVSITGHAGGGHKEFRRSHSAAGTREKTSFTSMSRTRGSSR
jgi:7,8-dihydropterin-6-yl-methyl-4-(beta-D-ribofuranosyl)aminobenzene 5'-phosphate synthase